jgi:hypothetical protein
MRHIVTRGLTRSIHNFSSLSNRRINFRGGKKNVYFDFLYNLSLKHFLFEEEMSEI